MKEIKIKKNQIWKSKQSGQQMLIFQKKENERWLCKVLTDKPDVYAGSHKMHTRTLLRRFELMT